MAQETVAESGEDAAKEPWMVASAEIGRTADSDVFLFSGEIGDESADELIRLCRRKNRRTNAFLILTSRGGSPDAAFRMARCLQRYYSKITLCITGMCKSAGTLIAVGAHELVLTDFGEFGPLDVQLDKKDEMFETSSGLDITQALVSLNYRALSFFRSVMFDMRTGSKGGISTKLSAEIASKLAAGIYGPIYAQIDPLQLGAIERAVRIALEYGRRLASKSKNLKDGALEQLVTSYTSHSFVIDMDEAKEMFHNVRGPTPVEERLVSSLELIIRDETGETFVNVLNDLEETNDQQPPPGSDASTERAGSGEGDGIIDPAILVPPPGAGSSPGLVS